MENPEIFLAFLGLPAVGWCSWSIRKWLDGRYERRRLQTEDTRRQRTDAIAREVLASTALYDYARSTVTAAFHSPEHQQSVESVIANSIPIQRVIDARVAHAWNNQRYELDKMIRDRLTESNVPIQWDRVGQIF